MLFAVQVAILLPYLLGFEYRAGLILLLETGLLSLGVLAALFPRNAPFPYATKVPLRILVLWTIALSAFALGVMNFTIALEGKQIQWVPDLGLIATPPAFIDWILVNVGIAISEESMKIAFVNVIAMIYVRTTRREASVRVIGASTLIAVLLWVQGHYGLVTGIESIGALVTGLALMLSVACIKNYFPSVAAHAIYDLIAFLIH